MSTSTPHNRVEAPSARPMWSRRGLSSAGDLRAISLAPARSCQGTHARDRCSALAGNFRTDHFRRWAILRLPRTQATRRCWRCTTRSAAILDSGRLSRSIRGAAGAADISFTAGRVDMALDGLGLMGSGGHTVHETADLTTLASQTKRAAVLMYRLGRGYSGGAAALSLSRRLFFLWAAGARPSR